MRRVIATLTARRRRTTSTGINNVLLELISDALTMLGAVRFTKDVEYSYGSASCAAADADVVV